MQLRRSTYPGARNSPDLDTRGNNPPPLSHKEGCLAPSLTQPDPAGLKMTVNKRETNCSRVRAPEGAGRTNNASPGQVKGPTQGAEAPPAPRALGRNDSKRAWSWDHHKVVTLLPEYRKCLAEHHRPPQANRSSMKTGKFLKQTPTRKSNVRPTHLDFNKTLLDWMISRPQPEKKNCD